MHRRLPFLAFVLYVTLDLSNPFVAGAFNFNADECVEAAQREQRADAASDRAARSAQRFREHQAEMARVEPRVPMPDPRADWRSPAPLPHAAVAPPPSPSEDH